MPCTDELHRMQDKRDEWQNAQAEAEAAGTAADIAGGATGGTCAFAVFGIGIPACGAAAAALLYAMNEERKAQQKLEIAQNAYEEARAEYELCTALTSFIQRLTS